MFVLKSRIFELKFLYLTVVNVEKMFKNFGFFVIQVFVFHYK